MRGWESREFKRHTALILARSDSNWALASAEDDTACAAQCDARRNSKRNHVKQDRTIPTRASAQTLASAALRSDSSFLMRSSCCSLASSSWASLRACNQSQKPKPSPHSVQGARRRRQAEQQTWSRSSSAWRSISFCAWNCFTVSSCSARAVAARKDEIDIITTVAFG